MKYRWLGSSGLLVSRISLGTMTFGTDNWGCGEKESQDVWNTLEERTRPPDEYTGWFAKANYKRFFGAAEFHDERTELP
jgi:hypothetical protein